MHVLRPQFRIEEQQALDFASQRGFGMIVAADERGPRASHVPFVLEQRDGRTIVQIHFTARNPLVPLADGARRFLLIVAGDDAYISNDWYSSRDNVSTWLYEAVHLSGVAHLRGLDENRGHGDALLAVSEARLPKAPWDLAQMEPGKRESMLAAIRVVDLVVDTVGRPSSTSTKAMWIMSRSWTGWRGRRRAGIGGWRGRCKRCGRDLDMIFRDPGTLSRFTITPTDLFHARHLHSKPGGPRPCRQQRRRLCHAGGRRECRRGADHAAVEPSALSDPARAGAGDRTRCRSAERRRGARSRR